MFNALFKSPAWQLIVQSDWMTKLILLLLFFVSILCISIVIHKYINLKNQKKLLFFLLEEAKEVQSFNQLVQIGKNFKDTIGGEFLTENLMVLKNTLNQDQKLSESNLEYVELAANQCIDKLLIKSENNLTILGTSAAVAPLVGLFGTVWGLIHAFVNISQEKSADISVVAPGIAEALTTTLAGLIVAIPAMIAFNYFTNEIRKQEQQLSHFSDIYLNLVKQTFIK